MSEPRVLVLAGLDPSGRAGLLADGDALRALGARPILCATGIAAQSQKRLVRMEPVSVGALQAQVEGALEDGPIAAVKIGMVGTRELLEGLVAILGGPLKGVPVVVDPVLRTSSAGELFAGSPSEYLPLVGRADVLTPNLEEAGRLTGLECRDEAGMEQAARALAEKGARAVLLKGGHLEGEPVDLLWADGRARWFRKERIEVPVFTFHSKSSAGDPKRGTGCRLASAIAAGIARDFPLEQSVEQAIGYVREYLKSE